MNTQNSIVIYEAENGQTQIEVRLEQETLWLSLSQIVDLFERDKSVISRHLKNIFDAGELDRISVVAKMQQLRQTVRRIKLSFIT
jgi:hypothetical protein